MVSKWMNEGSDISINMDTGGNKVTIQENNNNNENDKSNNIHII